MIENVGSPSITITKIPATVKRTAVSFKNKTIEAVDQKGIIINKDGTWKNKKVQIVKGIKCYVPYYLVELMRAAEFYADSKNIEFGLYLKGKMENKCLIVDKDFLVPDQDVTSVHIDFNEDEGKKEEFNGVIHRHPHGVKGFSGTDDEYINQNYMFSLLYVDGEISRGIINFDVPNVGRIQMEMNVIYSVPYINDLEKFEGKIFKKETIHSSKNYPFTNELGVQGTFPFSDEKRLKAAGIRSFSEDDTADILKSLEDNTPVEEGIEDDDLDNIDGFDFSDDSSVEFQDELD